MMSLVPLVFSVSPMRLVKNFLLFRATRSRVVHPCPNLHPHPCHFDVVLGVMSRYGVLMGGPPLVDGTRHIGRGWWADVDECGVTLWVAGVTGEVESSLELNKTVEAS